MSRIIKKTKQMNQSETRAMFFREVVKNLLFIVVGLFIAKFSGCEPKPAVTSDIEKESKEVLKYVEESKKFNTKIDSLRTLIEGRPTTSKLVTNINNTYVNEKAKITSLSYDSATMYLTNWIDSLRYASSDEGLIKRRN